jgi:hypothetical protein
MPSPVPCSSRITEVRALPYAELCCLGDHRYYHPLRLPSRHPGLRCVPYTRACFRGFRPRPGRGRASPVERPTFAACRLPYAGAVPGCSRIHGPDCCLRPYTPGSARSVPYGVAFRRGRVHFRYGLQLRFSSLRRPDLAGRRRLTSGLLWRLARAGLPPADRSPLTRAHGVKAAFHQLSLLAFHRTYVRPSLSDPRPVRADRPGPAPDAGCYLLPDRRLADLYS